MEAIPARDLLLISAAPLAAAIGQVLAPTLLGPYSRLVWLLALVPVFLLTRYRGWNGAGVALVGSVGLLLLAEALTALPRGMQIDWPAVGAVAVVLASVALGAGLECQWRRDRFPLAPVGGLPGRAEAEALRHLPDREVIEFLLVKAFSGAKREPPLAIVLIEIDRLEEYAHMYGEEAAYQALGLMAEALSRHTRSMNVFGRFGAYSCMVLLAGEDLAGAHAFAARLLREIERYRAPWNGRIHLNAGVAGFEPGLAGPGDLVQRAERALETARGMGGSRCVVYVGHHTPEPEVRGMVILRPDGQVKEVHRAV